ncbi:unnamed protein product [Nesidiocoris tenuis]|uniref:Uncharacterized protein n=1 Tax=Nesidiocoris tenuis TaxID=355587 RepID=A0A6H5HMG5_9HEMI|nr:unnamed protein product [Nesidiocoris tenuis]
MAFHWYLESRIGADQGFELLRQAYTLSNRKISCAVKMDHHPFRRIECERADEFNPSQPVSVFRTDESRSSVCCVYVQPHALRLALHYHLQEEL